MGQAIVRLQKIEIKNLKNVEFGALDFEDADTGYNASILGLYGQNGSGKTALVDALELLKFALTGMAVPQRFTDYINVGHKKASIKYKFRIKGPQEDETYTVYYELSLAKEIAETGQNVDTAINALGCRAVLCNEIVSFAFQGNKDKSARLSTIIDTSSQGDLAFTPQVRYRALMGNDKKTDKELSVYKKICRTTSRSFIFSREFLSKFRENCHNNYYRFPIESLVNYGNFELFVINTSNAGLITLNALPLAFNLTGKEISAIGNILLDLNGAALVPESAVNVVERVIAKMNIVLRQIVPGLTISVKILSNDLMSNNTVGCHIQLVSHRNDKHIPFQYESEGIKRLVSVLQLLIVLYNSPSITVAIDELDSGIFEYLLGELLRILSEKGKGQLIFTSHNLRPLETLDKHFVAFTTTNPKKRYCRMNGVKATNNLRDLYFRNIILDEQKESLYEPTNNSEIALAFREAGDPTGVKNEK